MYMIAVSERYQLECLVTLIVTVSNAVRHGTNVQILRARISPHKVAYHTRGYYGVKIP